MSYPNDNLYFIIFQDDSTNFYVEQNATLIPLFESKVIRDTNKILNCPSIVNLGEVSCETFIRIVDSGMPEKITIQLIRPSNLDARNHFFELLEENQEISATGGKRKRRKSLKKRRKGLKKRSLKKRRTLKKKN